MKRIIWIIVIVCMAGVLRFWRLTDVPPALNSDEIAIGYNAYSVLTTGRDEYNTPYPFTFRSFDDYKMPVYVYVVAGSMRILGYNDFAVRFPSALFGTITVLFTYLLVRELFKRRDIAVVSSLLLAISPWSIHFSRSGYEANAAVFFVVAAAYVFLKKSYILSSVLFSLSIWTYLTPRIFVPLLVLGLALIYRREIWSKKFEALIALLIAVALLLPIVKMSLSPEGQMRAAGVSAFGNPDDLKKSALRTLRDQEKGLKVFTIFDNRRMTYARTFLRGYFSHFDPSFLFLDRAIEKYRAPDMGLLYLFELPLIIVGSYMLFKKWSYSSSIVFWWMLTAPVAAAFTLQLPHPVRTLVFLPTFQIIAGVGLVTVWEKFQRIRWVILLIIFLSLLYYLHQYFAFLPIEDAEYWYEGRKEMTQKIAGYEEAYDKIIVSNALDFPYIFYLYYRPVDPAVYLKQGGTVSGGFEEQKNHFGKVEFRSISTSLRDPAKKILFVGLPGEVFKQSLTVDTVYYPDGSPAIVFFR